MGLPIALIGLIFLIDYVEEKNNKFLYFIVIAALLKPIYICFTAAILLKERNIKKFIIKLTYILTSVIGLYGLLYIIDPVNFNGFINNTSYLTNSIDLGFGFISITKEFMDFFRIHYENLSILTFIGSAACIIHIFMIYFLCGGPHIIEIFANGQSCGVNNFGISQFAPMILSTSVVDATCNQLGSATVNIDGVGASQLNNYCASSPQYINYSTIDNVELNGDSISITNNTSNNCSDYSDYTNISADLTPGNTYTLNLSRAGDEIVESTATTI